MMTVASSTGPKWGENNDQLWQRAAQFHPPSSPLVLAVCGSAFRGGYGRAKQDAGLPAGVPLPARRGPCGGRASCGAECSRPPGRPRRLVAVGHAEHTRRPSSDAELARDGLDTHRHHLCRRDGPRDQRRALSHQHPHRPPRLCGRCPDRLAAGGQSAAGRDLREVPHQTDVAGRQDPCGDHGLLVDRRGLPQTARLASLRVRSDAGRTEGPERA